MKKTDKPIEQKMSDRLGELFDLYPIDDLQPTQISEEMKVGLARFYADAGQRKYIENAVKIALKNMSIAPDPVTIAYYKSRVDVLEQLLAKGKQMFTNMEVLTKGIPDAKV